MELTVHVPPVALTTYPVQMLKGIGPKSLSALQQLNIVTIQDLLFHLPTRYEDKTRVTPLREATPGSKVLIEGRIVQGHIQLGKRKSLLCRLADESSDILLRFFHFNAKQLEQLTTPGTLLRCFGEVRSGYRGGLEMIHPEYRAHEQCAELAIMDRLSAIYATTQGISQAMWRKWMAQALDLLSKSQALPELLPPNAQSFFGNLSLTDALVFLHNPPADVDVHLLLQGKHLAQQRLAFEELVAHQLGLLELRQQFRCHVAKKLPVKQRGLQRQLLASLPFALTGAQQRDSEIAA